MTLDEVRQRAAALGMALDYSPDGSGLNDYMLSSPDMAMTFNTLSGVAEYLDRREEWAKARSRAAVSRATH